MDDPPTGTSTSRSRATPRCDPWFLLGRHGPRFHASHLTNAETSTHTVPFPLAQSHHSSTAASERPRRQGFDPMARAGHWKGLRLRNDTTLRGRRGLSACERHGDASFWHPSRGPPSGPLEAPARDVSTSVRGKSSRILLRRAAVPSESSPSSLSSLSSSSSGESSSDSPPCLDLARRTSSACRSRFFFFVFFFSASFTDFYFSAEACLFARSTLSSFTGGFEDRKSLVPL